MTDSAGDGSVECTACGAVWIIASAQKGSDGAFDECLQCGGTLTPGDATGPDQE